MKPRDDLFWLVRSLTKSEKSAFTKATSNAGEDKAYVKLYKALGKIKQGGFYDEKAFLEKHKDEAFVKNFPVRKTELYDKILSVLRSQRQFRKGDKAIDFQVREWLEDAWLLKEMKLFDQSKTRLQKARREADKCHFHEVLLEILKAERTLLMSEMPKGLVEKIEAVHAEIQIVTQKIHNKFSMLALKDRIFVFVRQHQELNGQFDTVGLQAVMQAPELAEFSHCKSMEAESNYHLCHAMYHALMGDPAEAWIHARSQYLMWQEQRDLQRIKPVDYRNVLQNYLSFCNEALRYDDFDKALEQMMAGKFHSVAEKAATVHNSLNVRLQQALNLCRWQEADAIRGEYQEKLEEFSEWLMRSRIMTFYLSFSRLDMVKNEWASAIKWGKRVLDEGGKDLRIGLIFEAQLQITVSLYMLGDFERVAKQCRYLLDNLKKNDAARAFEKRILTILRRYSVNLTCQPAHLQAEFRSLLAELHSDLGSQRMADSITFAWVRAQAENHSLKETLEADLRAQIAKLSQ